MAITSTSVELIAATIKDADGEGAAQTYIEGVTSGVESILSRRFPQMVGEEETQPNAHL